ncbi:MAG: 16S rRNA (uracil(1498)-N(3))-methyltransferase [Ruminococcaceae bacterium]|nr:16S rRNA (uracil(1498)-N(3))-methyltransferase [Oscillospiraceae bacterium]
MPRFFLSADRLNESPVIITGEDHLHMSRSLRLREGDAVTVCDGEGNDHLCKILRFSKEETELSVIAVSANESEMPHRVTLFQAIPKGEKIDYCIQKAVECGVFEIVFFESDRTVVRLEGRETDKKIARWQKIAESAAKQSGRGRIPLIRIASFESLLKEAGEHSLSFFCHTAEGQRSLKTLLREKKPSGALSFFVGPEGGFSEEETQAALDAGIEPVSLGRRILRSETAAHFILACLAYETEL